MFFNPCEVGFFCTDVEGVYVYDSYKIQLFESDPAIWFLCEESYVLLTFDGTITQSDFYNRFYKAFEDNHHETLVSHIKSFQRNSKIDKLIQCSCQIPNA